MRLIHALNVATQFTARILDEVCDDGEFRDLSAQTPFLRPLFVKHLHDVIYSTPQRYHALLMTRPSPTITVDSNLTISFAGEWIHRWRAHNSDVFFSFLKHWHVILSEHLQTATSELSVAAVAAAPGYLAIQGHLLRMVDSFIHRSSNELPAHPLPAPHHKTLSQSTLCKRAFERHPSGPLGPPMPVHMQQGNRIQDSIHAMALLMNSGDGRPQGIEKAEKKIAKAVSGVLSAVRKTQSSKPIIPVRPGLLGGESDDTLSSGTQTVTNSEGDVSSTPRTVSTSDISSLVSSNKSYSSSDRRTSLPSLQFQQHLVSLFAVLFERTLKAAVRKTSVWEGQACFALCDVIERLIPVIDDALTKSQDTLTSLDWPFWTDVVKRLVLKSENSVTQVRAFGFLFNIWERCPCGGDWLLNQDIWETFFCHWSTLVRCYFMNLVCWRVCMSGQGGVSVDPYVQCKVMLTYQINYFIIEETTRNCSAKEHCAHSLCTGQQPSYPCIEGIESLAQSSIGRYCHESIGPRVWDNFRFDCSRVACFTRYDRERRARCAKTPIPWINSGDSAQQRCKCLERQGRKERFPVEHFQRSIRKEQIKETGCETNPGSTGGHCTGEVNGEFENSSNHSNTIGINASPTPSSNSRPSVS